MNRENSAKSEEQIHEFFAVTQSGSLYMVSDTRDETNTPIVEKLARIGKSAISVGGRLKNGYLIGITKLFIFLYCPGLNPRDRPENVDITLWGENTSPIVALFINREDAEKCLKCRDPQQLDKRWLDSTKEVLRAIGKNHPVFRISLSPQYFGFEDILGQQQ